MSGHSHAKTVRKKKEADAKKRGQIFSKMSRLIWVAVKQGGPKLETNSKLRMAVEMAKSYNMPWENIERAIKRASGEIEGEEKLEEISFEALGPGGIALIIEGITDNKNRTLAEIKNVLGRFGGKLTNEGSVKWMFERKGCITVNIKEQNQITKGDLEMIAIESGAQDLYWHNDDLDIYTEIKELEEVRRNLENKGVKISSISLDWKPREIINLDDKKKKECQNLFEALDELDSVQEIYSNLNF